MMKQIFGVALISATLLAATPGIVVAQDAAEQPAAGETTGLVESPDAPKAKAKSSTSLLAVIFGSGFLGVLLWLALFGSAAAAIYFIVDCSILVKPQKIIPQSLVDQITTAMADGDVLKALKACESEPGPLANILSAGFSHVEEGYDIIQEAIGTAADLETERLMQRLNWISVCANVAPMLGLLGTVQGMIMAFEGLATGAPDVSALALAISQALWTTAAGLSVAIPAVTFFYGIRNSANRVILRMQAMTFELIKDLRNVEVVDG